LGGLIQPADAKVQQVLIAHIEALEREIVAIRSHNASCLIKAK